MDVGLNGWVYVGLNRWMDVGLNGWMGVGLTWYIDNWLLGQKSAVTCQQCP